MRSKGFAKIDSTRIGIGFIVLALLSSGCLGEPSGEVERSWGKAYRATMQAQIVNEDPQPSESDGLDSLTADLILQNYQDDTRRDSSEDRETFIIDTGVN